MHKLKFIYKAAEVYPEWKEIIDSLSYDDLEYEVSHWQFQNPRKHWRGLLKHLQEVIKKKERQARIEKLRQTKYGDTKAALQNIVDGEVDFNDVMHLFAVGSKFIKEFTRDEY